MKRNLKKAVRLIREANENLTKARVLLKEYEVYINSSEVVVPFDIENLANELGETTTTKGSILGGTDTSFTCEGIKFVQYGF